MWLFYVPVPKGKGEELANQMLDTCKCVNILESTSIYKVEGKLVKEAEEIMVIKTLTPKELEVRIKKIHPYKIPAIIKVKAETNDEYGKWLKT
ncbi:MAG: divalent-cation tolerance protein CutA [Candidatus Altiarchaeota archaeon]|nr:divalent-cation tolerance protein CutA [Candidatus Altiarchaeota archaeon]